MRLLRLRKKAQILLNTKTYYWNYLVLGFVFLCYLYPLHQFSLFWIILPQAGASLSRVHPIVLVCPILWCSIASSTYLSFDNHIKRLQRLWRYRGSILYFIFRNCFFFLGCGLHIYYWKLEIVCTISKSEPKHFAQMHT
jgi:hypothetical protein